MSLENYFERRPVEPVSIFEQQRRDFGKAHQMGGDILLTTKKIFRAIVEEISVKYPERKTDIDGYADEFGAGLKFIATLGNFEPRRIKIRINPDGGVGELCEAVVGRFKEILGLTLTARHMDRFASEVGQEVGELVDVCRLYRTVFFGEKPQMPPTPGELGIAPQAWLSGLGDVPGELKRAVNNIVAGHCVPRRDQLLFNLRLYKVERIIFDFMAPYEAEYGAVINNSSRPGYFNTYRGLLGRMRGTITHLQNELIEALGEIP